MCGIVGIFNLNKQPVPEKALKSMADSISHRGPDGEGFFIDGSLGMGHRRLSIIDLSSAGSQPMISDDGRHTIVYNGEIYNFQKIRKELEAQGYKFISTSDTEVVINAYRCWGPDCVKKFNGMFAFCIWDQVRRELFMARDRYGIKPLYYSFVNNTMLFASENKAFMKYPYFIQELDLEALVEYFTFQNIFTDRTFYKGARLFPAGSWAAIREGDHPHSLSVHKYWDYDFSEPERIADDNEYREELERLFVQAVRRQLVSDVEVGAYLSGGLDSGSITAIVARQLPYMKSFTCGFDLHSASGLELAFDEREQAEYMSYLYKTEHYEMVLKAGDMQRVINKLVWHLEEPRVGQSYPNYYIAQLASKFVKVVLSGTGGDELFGGYPWRYYRAVVNEDFNQYIDKYYAFWQRLVLDDVKKDFFQPVWKEVSHIDTREIFQSVFQKHAPALTRPEDYVNHSLYFEARTFLQGLLLVEDKLSMAHGLESRVPFLDNDLVDFAMHLPVHLKLKNLSSVISLNENEPGHKTSIYYNQTGDGKLLLRDIMNKFMPEEVIKNKKQGFSAPDASWFRGESIDYVKQIVNSRDARIFSFLNRNKVMDELDQHFQGKKNLRLLIWSIINSDYWCRLYM